MKKYEVYCKDSITGGFFTVIVEATNQTKLTDVLKYATMKTFGMDAFGVKEESYSNFKHGTVLNGLTF